VCSVEAVESNVLIQGQLASTAFIATASTNSTTTTSPFVDTASLIVMPSTVTPALPIAYQAVSATPAVLPCTSSLVGPYIAAQPRPCDVSRPPPSLLSPHNSLTTKIRAGRCFTLQASGAKFTPYWQLQLHVYPSSRDANQLSTFHSTSAILVLDVQLIK